jgi:hypothetical protein
MLTLEDCMGLCELTKEEIAEIARYEHIPTLSATLLGSYLCRSAEGEMSLKSMFRDDLAQCVACGDRERALALKLMLRDYILQHPSCEERHRAGLHMPERRQSAAVT